MKVLKCLKEYIYGNFKNIIKIIMLVFAMIILLGAVIIKNNMINENKWYSNNKLVGHALYGINNQYYTNSYEALKLGYNKGIRIFEADFLLTFDEKLVLKHDWENDIVLTYEEYMSKKIYDKYTPMDIRDLLQFMKENKDIYIVVDTKQEDYDKSKFLDVYKKIVQEANDMDSVLLDRFIIQIYQYEDLSRIKKIYNFKDYIFTVYKLNKLSTIKLVMFCKINNIDTIVMPKEYITNVIQKKDISFIKNNKINIYLHTINKQEEYKKVLDYGVDGIYTDIISMQQKEG